MAEGADQSGGGRAMIDTGDGVARTAPRDDLDARTSRIDTHTQIGEAE